MQLLKEHNILIFLIELLVLLGLARSFGELFRRWGQPAIAAEILVGVILGPTVFGRFAPDAYSVVFPDEPIQRYMLETVSWIGVLFLLLSNGLDVDVSVAWKQRKDSFTIAVTDIVIPLVLGFGAALLIPDSFLGQNSSRYIFAAFVGTALTISALPVAVRAMHDLNILRSDMGLLVLSALTINDVIGWVVFTLVLGIAAGTANVLYLVTVLAATVGFAILCLLPGRKGVDFVLRRLNQLQLPQPGTSLTFIVLLGLFCGSVTQFIGIHALFGFFLAGVMVGDSPAVTERSRTIINQMVYSIFVPLFFVSIGLNVDFAKNFNVLLVVGLAVVGIAGRFLGAYVGTLRSALASHERLPVAIAHTPGGAMEVVLAVLALQIGLITTPIFVAIIFGAIASSAIVGPWMAWALGRRKRAGILDYFMPRRFVMSLAGPTQMRAIQELCSAAASEEAMPHDDAIFSEVADREQTMSTAIGSGVACPHARLVGIRNPKVVLGIARQGIDWDAPDGVPVRFVFLILTPSDDVESQVNILAVIARAMIRAEVRDELIAAEDREKVWQILQQRLQEESA